VIPGTIGYHDYKILKSSFGILKSETPASAGILPLEMPIALFDYIK
jgi:hypothetical protein